MIRPGKQTGYILLSVIVVITLVAAIALLITTESVLESNTAGSELDAQQAQYVAGAGLNHALWLNRQQGCGPYGDLTNEPLGNDKYSSSLTTDLGSTDAVTVNVDQDSWIRNDDTPKTHPSDSKLHIRFEGGTIERPVYRYDLSSIPASASILSAIAWFHVNKEHSEGPVDIHALDADWTDANANWDLLGDKMNATILATIPAQPISVWVSVNLTSQVQAWVNGQPNYGITLNSNSEGTHGEYSSIESANAPYLEVVVGTAPTSPAQLKSVGTLANGVSRTINRNDVVLYQRPTGVLQLQPDAADGEDAEIFEQSPNSNYGSSAETWVSSAASDTTRSLLRFNMGALPTGARIQSANLSLKRWTGSGSDQPVSAHRIRNSWSEDSVTWNKRESGTNWDTAGGDFDNRAVSTTPVGPANDRYTWNITPLVQGWVDGSYPNYGVALVAAVDGMPGEQFHTSDDADPSRWPSLSTTYTCACGEVCLMPQGSGKIALIGDDNSPDPADQLKIQIIESWGYEVDFYEDWHSNTINWSNYDLVYVSETVISDDVRADLSNLSIGVVNEEPNLYDDLRLAGGDTEHVGSSIDIVDNSHFITSIFPLGALPIYAADMEILTADPTLAGGLQILGEFSGAASLTAIDQGAATTSGTAAGRRVTLPLGQHFAAGFDWMHLNNNGRLLVQRAIKWGIGNDIVAIGELLMVVGNAGGLTTQENAKRSLIESWGYNVNVIDEDDSQAQFDAAVATNDVVYIGEDVNAGDLGTKLVGATIGVVTEEARLADEFGFADGIHWGSGTSLNIDNTHYITTPLASGPVTILTATESLADLTGTLTPDIQVIGGSADGPALATIDVGESLIGGGTAAGRRVILPWGGNDLDINHLNVDGRTIMQRSLEWAGGAGCGSLQPLLLVVGDATTLSSKDDGMKTLMESWCYSVTLIDDGDSQALFDAMAAAVDVVYVSGTTSGPALRDKLTGSLTPIVNEINGKLDNFGFSSSTASSVTASAFSATNASHYISELFTGNPVTFFSTDLAMPVPGGTLAPGLQTVGETAGAIPALVTLDAGAQRWDATLAPARRVHLPFTNAEISQLTADGETLMQRAIEWAGGVGDSGAPGPIAHWKLDETSGTTAVDSVGGNDGTLINWPASPDWIPAVLDGGLSFDGSNDYIDVSSMNPLSYDDFTIVAWYKSADTSVGDDEYIFMHGDGYLDALTFGPTDDGGGTLRLATYVSGVTDRHYGTSDIIDQQWHHLVAVRAGGRVKIYVDGVMESDEIDNHAGQTVTVNGEGPFIGDYPGHTEQVHGTLDDVRFYDRGLNATEIADLFAAGGGSG
ncbi:MAG: DNRLRE domain-containing protein, partial [Gammaproteobacteria bacterium]|nr:DNRLRE domain-containing protein [Gammaproteobacteria bacterium]